jgi:hypothetical protein
VRIGWAARAQDGPALLAQRTAIERVYYQHRTGTKAPFAQTLPPAQLEGLLRQDLKKEAVLHDHYGVAITPALLQAEVQRINTTTRAPELLVEIKAALDNDPARFANAFARPILVERLLRDRFDNDDHLHAATLRACEAARAGLLAPRTNRAGPTELLARLKTCDSNALTETTWQLSAPPAETNAPSADELEIKKRFGPDAQILTSLHPGEEKERK